MKIIFFSESYKPYVSGVVKSIETFKKQLIKKGHQVYIFAPDYPEAEPEPGVFRFKSIPAFTHPDFRLPLPFSPGLKNKIADLKPDIIHTHSPFLVGWLARYISGKLNKPLVFTYHTLYEKYSHYAPLGESLVKKLTVKFTRRFCDSCDLIIAPSQYVKNRLKKYNISPKILTIPTGIDISLYKKKHPGWIRKKYSLKDKDKILLFVGRLGEEKNLEFLLKTFQSLSRNIDDVKLIIIGDGPHKARLIKLRNNLNLKDKVIFTGLQPYNRVIDFYLFSDVFVFPSLTETQGLVILEAMAGGLPVVAVDAAGSTAMINSGKNGLVVKEDIKEFARAVKQILSDKNQYQIYSQNARKTARKFTIENMTQKMLKGYHDIT
ncbi:MAG: glycosyltransferase family 4 protein [Bacillota bacterium]